MSFQYAFFSAMHAEDWGFSILPLWFEDGSQGPLVNVTHVTFGEPVPNHEQLPDLTYVGQVPLGMFGTNHYHFPSKMTCKTCVFKAIPQQEEEAEKETENNEESTQERRFVRVVKKVKKT